MYYVGIDIGGTYVKCGIVDGEGNVITKGELPSQSSGGAEAVMDVAIMLINKLLTEANLKLAQISAIGAGVPGMMDTAKGVIVYSNNLGWKKVKFSEYIKKHTGINTYISNDANVAALGEAMYGAAKGYNDCVMVTLGTGVGGGIIINKSIFEGHKGAGAEIGHMVIKSKGIKCTCGRRGCMETYCSATALIRQTKEAMLKNKDSQLWEIVGGDIEKVNGKTSFDGYYTDATAKKVVENYTTMMAEGLANIANVFRPELILLGGGISKQGEMLTDLIKVKLKKRIYGGKMGPQVELKIAALKNDAGFLGAASLAIQKHKQIMQKA